ncbi:MAG: outer membrane lipoprotein carrier protein LolA [Candidatus Omnitrophica bacterium]|nr:outer membrane lipoprotein carrier protein LolA [Candidatus Omnitrophota bacterium]MCM8793398.1 outer membrane lipoprotein carrier protein LolA [Candidatus Omnitrophota bacterium]
MKKIFLILVSVCLFNAISYGEEVQEVLRMVQEKVKAVNSYKADFILKIDSPTGEMLMKGNILFKREDKLKMEINMPNLPNATQLTVSDGKTMWQYLPFLKVASRVDLADLKKEFGDAYFAYAKEDISRPLKEAKEGSIKYLGKEKFGDKECFVLEAEPKRDYPRDVPFSRFKVWIDADSGLERKVVFYNDEGKELLIRSYENVFINTPLEDREFEFSPPEGTEIIEMTEETKAYIKREVGVSPQPSLFPEVSPNP